MKRRTYLAGTVAACLAGCSVLDGSSTTEFAVTHDWPTFGYDRSRRGVSPQREAVPLRRGHRWSVDAGGEIRGSPIVRDGRVYVHDRVYGRLTALDERTGEVRWEQSVGSDGLATPALEGDRLFVNGSGTSTLTALAVGSGEVLWQFESSHGSRSVAAADGTVLLGADSEGGRLVALDAADGTELWTEPFGREIFGTPAIVDGTAFVGSTDGTVRALALEDGAERWRFDTGAGVVSGVTVRHGLAYAGTQSGTVYALDRDAGDEVWSRPISGMVYPSPAVGPETLVAATWASGELRAFEATSGRHQWTLTEWLPTYLTSPVIVGDAVYVGSDEGVHSVELGTGERVEDYEAEAVGGMQCSPAICNDTVYIGDHDGTLHALSPAR